MEWIKDHKTHTTYPESGQRNDHIKTNINIHQEVQNGLRLLKLISNNTTRNLKILCSDAKKNRLKRISRETEKVKLNDKIFVQNVLRFSFSTFVERASFTTGKSLPNNSRWRCKKVRKYYEWYSKRLIQLWVRVFRFYFSSLIVFQSCM